MPENIQLNKNSIRNLLTIRYDPSPKSNINQIQPKQLRTTESDPEGYNTEKLLKKASDCLSTNNNSFAVSLSGGIDSTLSLALCRKIFPDKKIVGICAVFEDSFDESKTAKKIAEKFDSDFKVIPIESIFRNLPNLVSITKKPRWNTYQHFVAKEAKKHSKILITGDGADEVFTGYTFRYKKFLNLLQINDNWKTKTINYLECHNRDWVPDQDSIFGSKIKFNWNEIYDYFKKYFSNNLSPLKQVMLADYNGKLRLDFLPTSQNISDFYGIKNFSFFLDKDVIDYGLKLPVEQNYDESTKVGKIILRKISQRLGIKHLQDKYGFSPDILIDWKKHGKDIFESIMLSKDCNVYENKLINFNWVLRAYERVDDDLDIRYLNRLISIMSLEIWYRIFITKEMKSSRKLG